MRKTLARILAACLLAPTLALAAFDVADNYSVERYTASANQSAFTVPWAFEANDDVVVLAGPSGTTPTLKTLTVDYSVTGALSTSGTITFLAGHCDGTSNGCDAGSKVVVYRFSSPKVVQNFGSSISSAALNLNGDRIAAWVQELHDTVTNRALLFPITDDASGALPPMDGHGGDGICVTGAEDGVEYCANSAQGICGGNGTDNHVVRWNGTDECGMQDSTMSIADNGDAIVAGDLTAVGNIGSLLDVFGDNLRAEDGGVIFRETNPGNDYTLWEAGDQAASLSYVWPLAAPVAGEVLTVTNADNGQTDWLPRTYPITLAISGVPTAGECLPRVYFAEHVECPSGWESTEVHAGTAFTTGGTFLVNKNGTTVGSFIFGADDGPATTTTNADAVTDFPAHSYLQVCFPDPADATGADVTMTIACTKVP